MGASIVDFVVRDPNEEQQARNFSRWVRDEFPETTIRVVHYAGTGLTERGRRAPRARTFVPEVASNLVVVNASASLVAADPARSAVAEVVRTLRETQPALTILALLVRQWRSVALEHADHHTQSWLETAARGDATTPAAGPTAPEAVDAAKASLLEAGATDYVVVEDEMSAVAHRLVLHRLRQLLDRSQEWQRPRIHRSATRALRPAQERPTEAAHPAPSTAMAGPEPAVERAAAPVQTEDPFRTPWPALYNPASGRLDASRIAEALGAKLRPFAVALGLNYTAVHRAPDAPAYQAALRPVARMLEMVHDSLPQEEVRRAWLNRPRADLEDASPLEVVLAGEVGAIISLLEGVQLGIGG